MQTLILRLLNTHLFLKDKSTWRLLVILWILFFQIKQARAYLQEERAARMKAEARAEAAEKQLRLIQDLVFSVSWFLNKIFNLENLVI